MNPKGAGLNWHIALATGLANRATLAKFWATTKNPGNDYAYDPVPRDAQFVTGNRRAFRFSAKMLSSGRPDGLFFCFG